MDTLLTQEELKSAAADLSGWELGTERLKRTFSFSDFREAMAFMVRVSYTAEELNHHPNWSNVYSTVEVQVWSHDRGGVTGRCLALAKAMQVAAVG